MIARLIEVNGKLKVVETELGEIWDQLEGDKVRATILEKALDELKVKSAKKKMAAIEAILQTFKALKEFKESMVEF